MALSTLNFIPLEDIIMFKKLIPLICITAFIMSPSASFAGDTWKMIKNHFKNCEVKVQGLTTKQWAAVVNPKKAARKPNAGGTIGAMNTTQKTLLVIGVVVVAYAIYDNNKDDDPPIVPNDPCPAAACGGTYIGSCRKAG